MDTVIGQYQAEACGKLPGVVIQSKRALDEDRDFADCHGILVDHAAVGFSPPCPKISEAPPPPLAASKTASNPPDSREKALHALKSNSPKSPSHQAAEFRKDFTDHPAIRFIDALRFGSVPLGLEPVPPISLTADCFPSRIQSGFLPKPSYDPRFLSQSEGNSAAWIKWGVLAPDGDDIYRKRKAKVVAALRRTATAPAAIAAPTPPRQSFIGKISYTPGKKGLELGKRSRVHLERGTDQCCGPKTLGSKGCMDRPNAGIFKPLFIFYISVLGANYLKEYSPQLRRTSAPSILAHPPLRLRQTSFHHWCPECILATISGTQTCQQSAEHNLEIHARTTFESNTSGTSRLRHWHSLWNNYKTAIRKAKEIGASASVSAGGADNSGRRSGRRFGGLFGGATGEAG